MVFNVYTLGQFIRELAVKSYQIYAAQIYVYHARSRAHILIIGLIASVDVILYAHSESPLYARYLCSRDAATRPSARATIGYLVYKNHPHIAHDVGLKCFPDMFSVNN